MTFLLLGGQTFAQSDDNSIDWELQQKQMKEELVELQDNVDDTADELKQAFDAADPQSKEMIEEFNTELEKIGHDISVAAEKTENASEDTWENIKQEVSDNYAQLEDRVKRVEDALSE
jgi:gas vesicle protein